MYKALGIGGVSMRIYNNDIKEKVSKTIIFFLRWVLILSVGYIILFPLFQMISQALMTQEQYTDNSVVWIPKEFSLVNF